LKRKKKGEKINLVLSGPGWREKANLVCPNSLQTAPTGSGARGRKKKVETSIFPTELPGLRRVMVPHPRKTEGGYSARGMMREKREKREKHEKK